ARTGHPTLRLVVDTGLGALPALAGVRDVDVDDPALRRAPATARAAPVLLVDDIDELERARPAVGELVTGLLATGTCAVVASSTASTAAAAFRGVLPALTRLRRTLVLDAHDPASAELVGERAPWSVDPRHRPPGRGVLLSGRTATVVQVYAVGSATRPAAGDEP
ncbi:hypothetical protein, partial [uncultured Cellulomonas sp.]|uniref:hypothetical protein n=1 Tax=uncultured Cellulomonas sp. TaxID=189682 RepID=UPI0028E520B4